MKKDAKDIEGGTCMRGKDGRLGFSEKHYKRIWTNHMEEIMNKENDLGLHDSSQYGKRTN